MSDSEFWYRCRRWQVPLVALLLLPGCATSVSGWKPAFPWSAQAVSSARPEKAEGESNLSAEEKPPASNPFRSSEELNAKLAANTQAVPEKTASATGVGDVPRFDPATMMLIETEFKDATVEERKQWYQELRQVPPELVPQVLRMRRLARQAAQTAQTPPAQPETQPAIQQAAGTMPAAAAPSAVQHAAYPPAGNTLGGLAPWENPAAEPAPGASPITQVNNTVSAPANSSAQPNQPTALADYETPADPVQAPVEAGGTLDLQGRYQKSLEELISLSEQKIAGMTPGELEEDKLNYAAQHAYLRMLYLMANRQERALEAIPQLPTAEQEYWQQMFWALSSYFDSTGIPNPSDRATHTVTQLTEANLRLRERANLELRNLTFCQKIDGFGIYERFERDEFRPGQPVLVYAEMRNFLSEPTNDGQYKTILKSTIEIHRAGSHSGLVTRQDFAPTEDLCRNRRQDYFHSYMINIPERVTVGPHILKLIVEDQLNRKVASYTINFTVN